MGLFDMLKRQPSVPGKETDLKRIFFIVLLSIGALWFIGNLFSISAIPKIGPVFLVALIIFVLIAFYNMLYKKEMTGKDIFTVLLLTVLIILFLVYGKKYMPDFFSVAINQLQSVVIR